jgi:7,8-dihydropterin-6-yl-methyl-4-(beta-D-ribofuranosyl)aminobenzene 5'-phosphate synthase
MSSTTRLISFAAIALVMISGGAWQFRHQRGVEEADRIWRDTPVQALSGLGQTRSLSILPLVNWHAADDGLRTEAGVSYLVRTDRNSVLFDTGFNREQASPSPLEHNMAALGIALEDIDTIFLSHHHPDHSGGLGWVFDGTFSLGNTQADLSGKRIFAPIPLRYPGVEVNTTDAPAAIGAGLASIGPIRRQLALGPIDEQALAIHVENRGIVLLVGCGHQTLARILRRTRALFDVPIYGVIGDLHYPIPEGRGTLFGIDVQLRLGSGEGPLSPLTSADVDRDLALLSNLEPGIVALGGHDTSDEVIGRAAEVFGARARRVRVGEWIEVAGTDGAAAPGSARIPATLASPTTTWATSPARARQPPSHSSSAARSTVSQHFAISVPSKKPGFASVYMRNVLSHMNARN